MKNASPIVFLGLSGVSFWLSYTSLGFTGEEINTTSDGMNVCSLFEKADAERIIGRKSLFGYKNLAFPDGSASICDSDFVRVIVFSGVSSETSWEKMLADSGRVDEERHAISDLGEDAYVMYLQPRTEHEHPTTLVVAHTGPHTVALSVQALEGQSAESAQPQAVELTKIVLAKLH